MHERRFNAAIERLRAPERLARLEIERVVNACVQGIAVASVLDVGCGSGVFAEEFVKRHIAVTGIDPNPEMVRASTSFVPEGTFLPGTVEAIPVADKAFDLVFLGHVLHESDDLTKALAESRRCARQRVAILEWPYVEEEIGPPLHHRLKKPDVLEAAMLAGFTTHQVIELDHMILFLFE